MEVKNNHKEATNDKTNTSCSVGSKKKIGCEYCRFTGFVHSLPMCDTDVSTTSNCSRCNPNYYYSSNATDRSW